MTQTSFENLKYVLRKPKNTETYLHKIYESETTTTCYFSRTSVFEPEGVDICSLDSCLNFDNTIFSHDFNAKNAIIR